MENVQTTQPEEKEYSAFRYAFGAVLAFFGISSRTHRASKKRAKLVVDIATYAVLLFGTFLMIYPLWWMLAGSFANTHIPTNETMAGLAKDELREMIWWPVNFNTFKTGTEYGGPFYNYAYLFLSAFKGGGASGFPAGYSYWRAILNNLIYSVVPVVVGVITSASAAFSFAKINWIGRDKVFMFLLAAIMVPGPSIMIS